jgi:Fructose-1-6-bisphosphatase, N-terminal domain
MYISLVAIATALVGVAHLTAIFGFTGIISTKQMRTKQPTTPQPLTTANQIVYKPPNTCFQTLLLVGPEKSSVNGEVEEISASGSVDFIKPITTAIATSTILPKPFVKKKLQTYLRYLEVECWKRSDLRGLEPVLQAVASACKQITRIVQRAQTDDVYGVALDVHGNPLCDTNIQGEVQQKLDVLCNTIMLQAFCGSGRDIHAVASEEEDEPRCCSDVMVRCFE